MSTKKYQPVGPLGSKNKCLQKISAGGLVGFLKQVSTEKISRWVRWVPEIKRLMKFKASGSGGCRKTSDFFKDSRWVRWVVKS